MDLRLIGLKARLRQPLPYADCCAECGEEDTCCDFEAGSDEEACDAAVAVVEAFGGSINDAECCVVFNGVDTATEGDALFMVDEDGLTTVVSEDDLVDGAVATFSVISTFAANSVGQVAFWADLSDGRKAVVRADPVGLTTPGDPGDDPDPTDPDPTDPDPTAPFPVDPEPEAACGCQAPLGAFPTSLGFGLLWFGVRRRGF